MPLLLPPRRLRVAAAEAAAAHATHAALLPAQARQRRRPGQRALVLVGREDASPGVAQPAEHRGRVHSHALLLQQL